MKLGGRLSLRWCENDRLCSDKNCSDLAAAVAKCCEEAGQGDR